MTHPFLDWLLTHRTKILGITQLTIAQIMLWDFIPPNVGVVLSSVNGLLTVWVGFLNSNKSEQ